MAKVKSENFIHVPGSDVDSIESSCSDSSGANNMGFCKSTIKKSDLFKLRKLLYPGTFLILRLGSVHALACLFGAFSLFILFISCNQTFEPMQENNAYFFTFYGYLDAAADTQWVRVAPARDHINASPEIPEFQMTIEELENGIPTGMNKKLVQFGQDFNAINAWSELQVEHGKSYRLIAERPDGASSHVMVSLPEDFPTPVFIEDRSVLTSNPLENRVLVRDVERLADFQTIWYVQIHAPGYVEKRIFTFSYRNTAQHVSGFGDYLVITFRPEVERDYVLNEIGVTGEVEVIHRQVFIASASPDWIEDIDSIDDITFGLPESISNVENGLGYVTGITSKIIPYKTCVDEQRVIIACPVEKRFW